MIAILLWHNDFPNTFNSTTPTLNPTSSSGVASGAMYSAVPTSDTCRPLPNWDFLGSRDSGPKVLGLSGSGQGLAGQHLRSM